MKQKKLIGLQKKLTLASMSIILFISVILVLVGGYFIYNSNMDTLTDTTKTSISSTSMFLEQTISNMEKEAVLISSLQTIKDEFATKEEKLIAMGSIRDQNNLDEVGFVDLNGKGYSNYGDFDFNDQQHYLEAKKGNVYISEPIVNRLNGELILISSSPVYNESEIIGTIYVVDSALKVNDKVASLQFGKSGYAYVVNADGTNNIPQ